MVLEALGLASASLWGLFEWNRDVYSFDRDQRLKREKLRIDMQMERFKLFRSDIDNLVELTVSRMDMYHVVGALVLKFCMLLFAKGRIANAPVFLLSVYMISTACAFLYLLLALWLAMHAAIASKSFGTRLLLRHVRLPLPTNAQIDAVASNLADYERQGVREMLRMPFVQQSHWKSFPPVEDDEMSLSRGDGKLLEQGSQNGKMHKLGDELVGRKEFLSDAEPVFQEDSELMNPTMISPGDHAELFRRLQEKWSCYDAYARVCMSIGMNQLLQSLTYFMVEVSLVENNSPTLGVSLVVLFQAAAVALAVLDISGYRRCTVLMTSAMNCLPVLAAVVVVSLAKRDDLGMIRDHQTFALSFVIFAAYFVWLQVLLTIAAPDLGSCIPTSFRAVFYSDVFGDAEDPRDVRVGSLRWKAISNYSSRINKLQQQAGVAKKASGKAAAALQLWVARGDTLSSEQRKELEKIQNRLQVWQALLQKQIKWCVAEKLLPVEVNMEEAYSIEDVFPNALIGPIKPKCAQVAYYLNVKGEIVGELAGNSTLISFEVLVSLVSSLGESVHTLRSMACKISVRDKHPNLPPPTKEANLPWLIVWSLTRVAQVVVLCLMVLSVLRGFNIWTIDYEINIQVEDRRLDGSTLSLEHVDVKWPHGSYFRPDTISCLPDGALLLGSPFLQYTAISTQDDRLMLRALASTIMPSKAVVACAVPKDNYTGYTPPCLVMLPGKGGLSIWQWVSMENHSEEVYLSFPGMSWTSVSGGIMHCANLESLYEIVPEAQGTEWCLVVTGWDGNTIPLAVAPLFSGMPKRGPLAPYFAIPMTWGVEQNGQSASQNLADQQLISLHLESYGSRLWLLAGSDVHLWDVQKLMKLGKWAIHSDIDLTKFLSRAMCLDSAFRLTVVGETALGPRLVRAMFPFSADSPATRMEYSQEPKVISEKFTPIEVSMRPQNKAFLRD
jgi:hypothetical protein